MGDHTDVRDGDGTDAATRREWRQRKMAEWEARLDQLRSLSVEELTDVVAKGSDLDRAIAVDALAERDDPRIFPLLLEILQTTEDLRVRDCAAIGLYDIGDQR